MTSPEKRDYNKLLELGIPPDEARRILSISYGYFPGDNITVPANSTLEAVERELERKQDELRKKLE